MRDGVVSIENFLDEAQVASITEEIRARTDLFTTRQSPNVVKRLARYLYLNAPNELPSTRQFFDSPVVNGIARATCRDVRCSIVPWCS